MEYFPIHIEDIVFFLKTGFRDADEVDKGTAAETELAADENTLKPINAAELSRKVRHHRD